MTPFTANKDNVSAYKVADGGFANEWYASATAVGDYFQVDLGSSQSLETVYMY